MACVRGGHTNPSASCEARPSASAPQDSSQASQALTVPSFEGVVPSSPPRCRYSTRRPPTSPPPEPSVHHNPPKKAKTSGLRETSSQAPADSQAPEDSQRPSNIALEVIIKRPMVTVPPIEGNSDCRARPFHSSFTSTLRLCNKIEPWIHLDRSKVFLPQWRWISIIHDYWRRVPQPFVSSIGGRGILEARHIAEALHIPFQPEDPAQFRQWSPISQRDMVRILLRRTSRDSFLLRKELPSGMLLVDILLQSNIFPLQHSVQRRGPILDALFRISEGFYFGPHHLIMAALLYFKKKVHRKKLQRDDMIPLLFQRLLCQILEHMGYPTEPHLERRHHCREHFTLDQWTQLAGKNPTESSSPTSAKISASTSDRA
ncbi:hypothetical protein AAG906_022646 [Vitis piasezkii]